MHLTTEPQNIQNKNWQNGKEKEKIHQEHLNTPISITYRTTRQEISKDIRDLSNTIKQFNLPCIEQPTQQ